MNERDRALVVSFKKKLMDNDVPVREVVAFGSRVRGDSHPDSDLDILVIVDEKNNLIRAKVSDCAWETGFESDVVIQSLVRTPQEWYEGLEKNTPFFQSLQQEGVRV